MTRSTIGQAAQELSGKLAAGLSGPLALLIPESWIVDAFRETGLVYRNRIYSPLVTIWAFIGQVLDADYSLRNAVAKVQALLVGLDRPAVANDTGAYCKARYRLPDVVLPRLTRRLGRELSDRAQVNDLWHGRRIKLVDGSSVSMPDTVENQAAYPQPSSQAAGVGYPIARIVGIFCLTTSGLLDLAIGPLKLGELSLFRWLRRILEKGDIVLADRLYSAYTDIVLLYREGVDTVVGIHASRKVDFRKGHRLGPDDHLVIWRKPRVRPPSVRASDWKRVPAWQQLRELRFSVQIKGHRHKKITLATTLLDHRAYPAEDLARLYARRWEVETDLGHIKTTLGMDVLRGEKPEMVRKEIWAHLLTYNLLRTLMWQAGEVHNVPQLRISLKGTIQHAHAFVTTTATSSPTVILERLLLLVAREQVPFRPGRAEPRQRRRRPKPYKLMTEPRAKLKRRLRSA